MKIKFEDICKDEHGHWARICHEHSCVPEILQLGSMECEYTCSANALCDVLGCRKAADYYIDFYKWDPQLQATNENLSSAMNSQMPVSVITK